MRKIILVLFTISISLLLISQEFSLTYRKYQKPAIISQMEKMLENAPDLEGKILIVKEFLKKAPQNVLIHRTYQDLMKIYDPDKLYQEYELLFQKNQNNPIYIYLFGRVQKKSETAKYYFEKSIERDKNFYWGYIGLSYYYTNEAKPPDYSKAEELLKKAISIDNSQPEAFLNLHSIYTMQRKYELADTVSDILTKINPDDDSIFLISINRFRRTGEKDRMISAIEKRIQEKGESPHLLLALADAYINNGNIGKTIEIFEKFVNLYPKNSNTPAILFNLSVLYSRKMDKINTIQYLRRAFEAGYNLRGWIENYPPFFFVKGEKEFKELINRINEKIGIGKKVKDFQCKDINGNLIDIRKLEGKVVLVDFCASWYEQCRAEIPFLREAYKRFGNKGLEIISVSLDDEKDALFSFISKEAIPWKVVFSGKGRNDPIAKIFGIDSIPSNFLVDKRGIMRYADLNGEVLIKRIEELLKEK
jgi:peroxiredoxin/Tfp pilus assembly protein PilF